jgi:hypothetical protein
MRGNHNDCARSSQDYSYQKAKDDRKHPIGACGNAMENFVCTQASGGGH